MMAVLGGTATAGPKVVIKPKISTSARYDTNYYKADARSRGVYTYRVDPGIQIGYETAKTRINADYVMQLHYYFDDDKRIKNSQTGKLEPKTSDSNFTGHLATLSAKTSPLDRVTLSLEDTFHRTRDPGSSDRFSNSTDRAEYYINKITPGIAYKFGDRFASQVRYQSEQVGYIDNAGEDSVENRGILNLIYKLNKKQSMDLEYKIWNRDYEYNSADYLSNEALLIYRQQFNHLGVEAGTGYHNRSFDEDTIEDKDGFAGKFAIVGQNPPAPKEARSYFRFGAEHDMNDLGTGDSYYRATKVELTGGHNFIKKFLVSASASYQYSDYLGSYGLDSSNKPVEREDDLLKLSGRVGYKLLDWLALSVETGWETRDSNHLGKDYDNTFVLGTLGLEYNVGEHLDK
jgi:hypothetical protein